MTKRMLIDATHSEETRVAVVDGNRLVDFDYESQVRKQLKGSIFLAKVTRVEPSLQAAFVNFGGNRHGFLPFTEIHPDYYRIPIADREAILAEQEREMEARLAEEEAEDADEDDDEEDDDEEEAEIIEVGGEGPAEAGEPDDDEVNGNVKESEESEADHADTGNRRYQGKGRGRDRGRGRGRNGHNRGGRGRHNKGRGRMAAHNRSVEIVGGDGIEGDQPIRPSLRKNYKIQEVVKRGQIMLVQVSKEERGNKGAAVSTYLSLPGRYCVLMPNSPRAGGVSRKIANFKERKRMREILNELKVPQGMSVIMRTAGTSRTKAEIKRDLDYLMKLWDNIRELTLSSTAPALVHEEGNLIRRSVRDIYSSDIEEVLVSGIEGYKFAKDFMKMMIPSHAKRVKEYKDEQIPLFHRYQTESQISDIGEPMVTLPSGGYLVINPTEALVSVDVNSGKSTKERHIEETALRTNIEAAEEVARQLKLRDLGGLVVIDFIDMEDRRNNRKVENKLKDALSTDRARIQIGRISSFGLLELSRQRLNPSLTEAQHEKCVHCQGVGHVKTIEATAITALRALEEEGIRDRAKEVSLQVATSVALYILNNKRHMLAEIEKRYGFAVTIDASDDMPQSQFTVEPAKAGAAPQAVQEPERPPADTGDRDEKDDDQPERGNRRRRGRRGGRRRGGRFDARPDQGETSSSKPERGQDRYQARSDETVSSGDDGEKPEDTAQKPKEEKGAKRPRKPAGKPAATREDKEVGKAEAKADESQAEKTADKDKGPKDEKPAGRKSAAKKSSARKTAKKAKDAGDKGTGKSDTETNVTDIASGKPSGAPSNDVAPQNKDYEVINEPPTQKKKGWWNKLTE